MTGLHPYENLVTHYGALKMLMINNCYWYKKIPHFIPKSIHSLLHLESKFGLKLQSNLLKNI